MKLENIRDKAIGLTAGLFDGSAGRRVCWTIIAAAVVYYAAVLVWGLL